MMSAEEINKAGWTYACERGTQGRMLLDQAKAAIELREKLQRLLISPNDYYAKDEAHKVLKLYEA